MCAVVIEPTTAGVVDYLNINEIQVFPPGRTARIGLTITMSSEYYDKGVHHKAARCIDGGNVSFCSTNSALENDPSPWLRVAYSCPSGQVEPGTKVVVINRPGFESRLSKFTLHFHNSTGRVAGASYSLAGAKAEYSFTWLRKYLQILMVCTAPKPLIKFNIVVNPCSRHHRPLRHHQCGLGRRQVCLQKSDCLRQQQSMLPPWWRLGCDQITVCVPKWHNMGQRNQRMQVVNHSWHHCPLRHRQRCLGWQQVRLQKPNCLCEQQSMLLPWWRLGCDQIAVCVPNWHNLGQRKQRMQVLNHWLGRLMRKRWPVLCIAGASMPFYAPLLAGLCTKLL